MRLFIGGHVSIEGGQPLGPIIQKVSEVFGHLKPPWVLGASGPLTHIFVVVTTEVYSFTGGMAWRLDAETPRARWHPIEIKADNSMHFPAPTALWELILPASRRLAGIQAAYGLDGHPYDLVELAGQLNPFTAALGGVTNADVCTGCGLLTLLACGGEPAKLAQEVQAKSRIPEQLGQALRASEGQGWCRRVL